MPEAPLRDEFPILEEKVYLVSHSLGAVPAATRDALGEYYDAWATEGIGAWDGPWWEAVETFDRQIEALLNAPEGTVAPMQNVTRGMAGVLSALDIEPPRNKVVTTDLEFSTSYPLLRGFERLGAEIEIVESQDGVTAPTKALVDAIDEETLLVPTCHVFFQSGALQDFGPLVERAREVGAHVLADAYQTVGTVPVDVEEMGVDFLVGGSHKWLCGGPGAGFLYVREDLIERLDPRLAGWFGLEDPFAFDQGTSRGTPAGDAHRFLGGTPNVPALFAAREGIERVREVGVERIRRRSVDLTDRILVHADAQDLSVKTPREADERGGMICLDFDGAARATERLQAQGILVDYRPDCGIRVSPHFYNTEDEVDAFFEALIKVA